MAIGLLAANVTGPSSLWATPVADFIDFTLRNGRKQILLPGRPYVPPEVAAGEVIRQ
jgi:hypothetical protein